MQENKVKVVVADDHPPVHDLVRRILEPDVDVIRCVCDGLELLDAVAELRPDVIVTDIAMPGMSGVEVLRALNADGHTIPSVVLSSHNDPRLIVAALESGARGYVIKRRAPLDLKKAVQAAIDGRRFLSAGLKLPDDDESGPSFLRLNWSAP